MYLHSSGGESISPTVIGVSCRDTFRWQEGKWDVQLMGREGLSGGGRGRERLQRDVRRPRTAYC